MATAYKFIPAPSAWHSAALERLHAALDVDANRWRPESDENTEYKGQLAAAMEAAESLDIALGNLGWVTTYHGSLDGGAA